MLIIQTLLLVLIVGLVWRSLLSGQECQRTLARLELAARPSVEAPHPVAQPAAPVRIVERRPSVRIELRDEHEAQVLGEARVMANARRPEMTLTDANGKTGRFQAAREEGGVFIYRRIRTR